MRVFILFFLSFNGVFSQHILIDYKISTNVILNEENFKLPKDDIDANYKQQAIKSFNEAYALLNDMKMHLKATSSEALFFGENKMSNEHNPELYNMAKIMIKNDYKYYTNLTKGTSSKWFNTLGKDFVIENSISKFNWKLTKESKYIEKYLCYKASMSYTVENSAGIFTKNVIAWYAPEIPFHFGPKGFSGLPGLILELTDDKITYVAEKICMNNEKIQIEQPLGAKIDQKDLDVMIRNASEERYQKYKN